MSARASVTRNRISEKSCWLPAALGIACAGAIAGPVFDLAIQRGAFGFGPLTQLMATHIFLMNILAPAAALVLRRGAPDRRISAGRSLVIASLLQMILLWAVHTPIALSAFHHGGRHALLSAALFWSALWFWIATFGQDGGRRWRAIASLLLTGKLFCLLGALLVFAPRALYLPHHGSFPSAPSGSLSDQHQAGLLMIAACPLTYVLAAVVIAASWLKELSERQPRRNSGRLFSMNA